MIKAIEELKKTHSIMTTLLNELAVLEDGLDADYSQVVIDYKWLCNELEHRRTTLQTRKNIIKMWVDYGRWGINCKKTR